MEDRKLSILDGVRSYKQKNTERIAIALNAGAMLTEAKDKTPRGEWKQYLIDVEIDKRTAQRWMQLAALGLESVTVTHLGGIRRTLELMPNANAADAIIDAFLEQVDYCKVFMKLFMEFGKATPEREWPVDMKHRALDIMEASSLYTEMLREAA